MQKLAISAVLLILILVAVGVTAAVFLRSGQTHILRFDQSNEAVVSPGLKEVSAGLFTLDTKYRQPFQFGIYYGQLQYSGISDDSGYDMLVVFDRNVQSVAKVRSQGTKIFQYIYFGSRFEDTEEYIQTTKSLIRSLKEQGLADGIFLDECDIAYWNAAYVDDPDKQQRFYQRLQEITEYIRSLGMESVINGTRSFAELGDYFLWESFLGYWSTNQLKWSAAALPDRTASSDDMAVYGRSFADWTFEATTHVSQGKVVGGQKGAMEIVLDMDALLRDEDRKDAYDWGYLEWFGEGGSDETVSVWAWVGDALPFDEARWEKLPQLWKGEAGSWNRIGRNSKYLKLRLEFQGADQLSMEEVLLTFDYLYPYWDMNASNGEADANPYRWNYNSAQLNDLQGRMTKDASPMKILTHTYGERGDAERMIYSYLGSAIYGFHAWNYAHPAMQTIDFPNILEEPLGMLLKNERTGSVATGYFTGGTATVDTSAKTYKLVRDEPAYFYDQAIAIDGEMSDWSQAEEVYRGDGPGFAANRQFLSLNGSVYAAGAFDNVQVVNRDGVEVLELVEDGTGTWTSPELGADKHHYAKRMSRIAWDGQGEGSVRYWIQYQDAEGQWTDWILSSEETSTPNHDFYQFRVKVELNGSASYTEMNPAANKEVFVPGASFRGAAHEWLIYVNDNVNVTGLWMTDDRQHLYIRMRVAGQIDFSTTDAEPSRHFYHFYLDTDHRSDTGFKGTWWNTPAAGADYRLTNHGLYRWNGQAADPHSNEGWEWLGTAGVDYRISAEQNEVEYRLKKSQLGGLNSSPTISMYMTAEEASTFYGMFIKPDSWNGAEFTGDVTYTQKVYHPYVPHGYLQSEPIELEEGTQAAALTWDEVAPESTMVKAWIRTGSPGNKVWSDWTEVTNGQKMKGSFSRIQYAIGLYTDDAQSSPEVSNIQLQIIEK